MSCVTGQALEGGVWVCEMLWVYVSVKGKTLSIYNADWHGLSLSPSLAFTPPLSHRIVATTVYAFYS